MQRLQVLERQFAAQDTELSQLRSANELFLLRTELAQLKAAQHQQVQPLAAPQPLLQPAQQIEQVPPPPPALQHSIPGGAAKSVDQPPPGNAGPSLGGDKGKGEVGDQASAASGGGGTREGGVGQGGEGLKNAFSGDGKEWGNDKKARGRPKGSSKPENVCAHNLLRSKCKECRVDRYVHFGCQFYFLSWRAAAELLRAHWIGPLGARQRRGFSPIAAVRHQGGSQSGRQKKWGVHPNLEKNGVYLLFEVFIYSTFQVFIWSRYSTTTNPPKFPPPSLGPTLMACGSCGTKAPPTPCATLRIQTKRGVLKMSGPIGHRIKIGVK